MNSNKVKTGLVFFRKDIDSKVKKRSIFWFVYFTICGLAQIWPIYLLANRVKPMILGMPLSMFWVVMWIVIIFIGTITKYNQEYGGD
ncbi:hypothetical protein [Sporosalibacterium faouarense]|uniref:hypothetical protein n=1 Tax=Sporosalibacterium faouarense TaxID=516123 RepID=UPI00141CCD49|nr:hypothetical protein [Sporosalibacterium faouarense]MTI47646.1 hypothetical protein [Bacillota bacterium]